MMIRTFAFGDEKAIRSLFQSCFDKELSHEEWSWKYEHSPWGSTAVIALENEEVIAHYGGIGMSFYYEGRTYKVFQPCDVMTHPKHRARIFAKRGAMIRSGEHFYEANKMDFAFGFPSERHAVLGTKQLNYTKHSYVSVLQKEVSRFKLQWIPFLKVETGWNAVYENDIEALWRDVRDDQGLSIEKNSHYISWRYKNHPNRKYEPFIVKTGHEGNIVAFAVFSVQASELFVMDFFFVKELGVKKLVRIFEKIARSKGLARIKLWANPHEKVFQGLIDNGFLPEKGIPYIFKIINTAIEEHFLFREYFYRMGDYDAL